MQYFRCCDHSNECLSLVFQQAEVLLNFFVECIYILKINDATYFCVFFDTI